MSDSDPKFRVVDDEAEKPAGDVVRLKAAGSSFDSVERLVPEPPHDEPERLESQPRELFDGRSQEPGVEAILDKEEVVGSVEQPWGMRDGRLAGVPYGWFVLVVMAVLAAGIWSVIQVRKGEQQVAQRMVEVRELKQEDAADDRTARELVERVETVVGDYLAADSWQEMLPVVRHPDRVKPLVEAEWKLRPNQPMAFSRLTLFQPATIPGGTFWVVRAEVKEGQPQSLILEQVGETDVRVDWETHVCHQPMEWEDYIAARPSEQAMDFRVWMVPDTHYSHEFSNAGQWRCYRLTTRGSEGYLFGYAAVDSDTVRELDGYFQQARGGAATVIARLRFPGAGQSPRGVVIEKLLQPRWLYATDPAKDGP